MNVMERVATRASKLISNSNIYHHENLICQSWTFFWTRKREFLERRSGDWTTKGVQNEKDVLRKWMGNNQTEWQDKRRKMQEIHVFITDVSVVPHHHKESSGTLRSWIVYELVTACTRQHMDSRHVFQKNWDFKFIEGHESIRTDGYDGFRTKNYMLSYKIQMWKPSYQKHPSIRRRSGPQRTARTWSAVWHWL